MDCHEVSKVIVRLPGSGRTFSAVVGVDADPGHDRELKKSAVFSVILGGKTAFRSEALKGGMKGTPVNVDLGGAREFILEVGDGSDGIGFDWANWADAKVILEDNRAIWLADLMSNQGSGRQSRVLWDPVITYLDSIVAGASRAG